MQQCTSCDGVVPPGRTTCPNCDAPRWWWRMPAILGPVGAVLLAACYGGPGRYARPEPTSNGPTRLDRDHDGAGGPWVCEAQTPECAQELSTMPPPQALDCDDNDPRRYPGAPDPAGDGIDQNCDGIDGTAQPNVQATP